MNSLFALATVWLAQIGNYNPAPNANIPGAGSLMDFANTLGFWGLIFCVIGLIISTIVTAVGRTAGNSILALGGLSGLVVSGLGAALIGGAAIWVNHLVNFGASWH
ncbi:MAG: DUF6112 family protein [Candidatus Dormibacteraeota bacterium]|nr:DUF6112 family protein [Candidatus Dormibacteraeota bacterium]